VADGLLLFWVGDVETLRARFFGAGFGFGAGFFGAGFGFGAGFFGFGAGFFGFGAGLPIRARIFAISWALVIC
jgi:hypothetical protein